MIGVVQRYLIGALLLGLLAAVLAILWYRSDAALARRGLAEVEAQRDAAVANAKQLSSVLDDERVKAKKLADVAEKYEKDKADAQATADRVAADLRSGNLKLRDEWVGCETSRVSAVAAGSAELDEGAAVRERLAGEIVRIGAECDAQVRGLQEVVRADRE